MNFENQLLLVKYSTSQNKDAGSIQHSVEMSVASFFGLFSLILIAPKVLLGILLFSSLGMIPGWPEVFRQLCDRAVRWCRKGSHLEPTFQPVDTDVTHESSAEKHPESREIFESPVEGSPHDSFTDAQRIVQGTWEAETVPVLYG